MKAHLYCLSMGGASLIVRHSLQLTISHAYYQSLEGFLTQDYVTDWECWPGGSGIWYEK